MLSVVWSVGAIFVYGMSGGAPLLARLSSNILDHTQKCMQNLWSEITLICEKYKFCNVLVCDDSMTTTSTSESNDKLEIEGQFIDASIRLIATISQQGFAMDPFSRLPKDVLLLCLRDLRHDQQSLLALRLSMPKSLLVSWLDEWIFACLSPPYTLSDSEIERGLSIVARDVGRKGTFLSLFSKRPPLTSLPSGMHKKAVLASRGLGSSVREKARREWKPLQMITSNSLFESAHLLSDGAAILCGHFIVSLNCNQSDANQQVVKLDKGLKHFTLLDCCFFG
jgi:hypothetical protein